MMLNQISGLTFVIILLFSSICFAGGTYEVTKDGGAYYFETNNDGCGGPQKLDM
jgi:hypothetical protein